MTEKLIAANMKFFKENNQELIMNNNTLMMKVNKNVNDRVDRPEDVSLH